MRVLSGPVSVCIDRPLLSLDRPFTYDLPEELGAGLGSVVQVSFHGRATRAWVLGETDDVPERMLRVRKLVSVVRSFDEPSLSLFRAMSGPCRRGGGLRPRRGPRPSRPTAAAPGCWRRFGRGWAHS
jgi:3'DNA-binding domain (3'BD)